VIASQGHPRVRSVYLRYDGRQGVHHEFSGRIARIFLDQGMQECIDNEESPISFRERM
jgi:hypothetical protein